MLLLLLLDFTASSSETSVVYTRWAIFVVDPPKYLCR